MLPIDIERSEKYVVLFASCLITRGHGRSLVIDSQRGSFDLIPNDMVDFIQNTKLYSIRALFKIYGADNKEIVTSYLSFILENEYGFLAHEKIRDQFPDIEVKWQHPSKVTNSIIDIKAFETTANIYPATIAQLDALLCEALQIRSYVSLSISQLTYLAEAIKNTCIEQLEIYVKYSEAVSKKELITLLLQHQKVSTIIVHSAPKEDECEVIKNLSSIYYTQQILTDETCCGLVEKQYFNSTKEHYMEANFHNSCLNRKIAIDGNGDIKNCPSMATSYGNVQRVNLATVLDNEAFTAVWNLKKDFVLTCQDCEFRYVCTDCRAYVEEPNNLYAKPLKCGYDPYTNEWSDWKENPLKQKAISHYQLADIKREVS